VGRLLEKHREAVASRLAHLLEAKNSKVLHGNSRLPPYTVGDLPLFPVPGRTWRQASKDRLGAVGTTTNFIAYYIAPLKSLSGRRLTCTVMRHTMGTQLAIAGCSSKTIAAVLLHATPYTAQVYVDLVFDGAIDELSDSLEPAFCAHFPVYKEFVSAKSWIEPEKRVVSHAYDRTEKHTTGECGRHQICEYAPIACYECPRFKPCYDVDHSINLDRVNAEIAGAKDAGLQRQVDVKRYMHIANRIRVVMSVCELKRAAIEPEPPCRGEVE
jgi:hypothetical protein